MMYVMMVWKIKTSRHAHVLHRSVGFSMFLLRRSFSMHSFGRAEFLPIRFQAPSAIRFLNTAQVIFHSSLLYYPKDGAKIAADFIVSCYFREELMIAEIGVRVVDR